jgi:NhaP-type Na+/H+ or K+/H+ antiporter
LNLSFYDILLLSSLICSSDVIAAMSIVKYDKQPKLFSLIFGEGITNDAVSIILFNTVHSIVHTEEFTYYTSLKIVGNFLYLSFFSILVGVIFGVISSLTFKNVRIFT